MPSTGWIIGAFLVIVVLFIIGFVLGINYRKRVAEKEMSSAEEEAKRIINEGIKSAENKKGVILLLDDLEVTRKKIMSAATDSEMKIVYDLENKPGISNLMNIYKSVTGKTFEEIEQEFEGKNYGEFKRCVADEVCSVIKKIQDRYNELLNSNELKEIFDNGMKKTNEIAKKKYEELKKLVGLQR